MSQDSCTQFPIRTTPQLLDAVQFQPRAIMKKEVIPGEHDAFRRLQAIKDACTSIISNNTAPRFKHSVQSIMPLLVINEQGVTSVREVLRPIRSPPPSPPTMLSKLDQRLRERRPFDSGILTPQDSEASMSDPSTAGSTPRTPSPHHNHLTWTLEIQTKSHRGWRRNDEITATYFNWFKKSGIKWGDIRRQSCPDHRGGQALNDCIYMMEEGIIPRNRNADNIDVELRDRDLLFFPSKPYQVNALIKAFSVTSFGFGQKGAQVIGVHLRYLFANVPEEQYNGYQRRVKKRLAKADQALQKGMYGGNQVQVKE